MARAVSSKALATLWDWAGAISEMAAPLTGSNVTQPRQRVPSDGLSPSAAPDNTDQKSFELAEFTAAALTGPVWGVGRCGGRGRDPASAPGGAEDGARQA